MALKCDICGKKSQSGGSHKHHRGVAGGQWKRRAPHTLRTIGVNLHWVTLPFGGIATRLHACAKCVKRVRFDIRKKAALAAAV